MPTQLTADSETVPADAPATPAPSLRRRLWNPTTVAGLTWLLLLPAAALVPGRLHADPFAPRAMAALLGLLFLGVAALALWSWLRPDRVISGVAAGAAAAWVLFTCRMALVGTPFGFGGMVGDMVRMSGLATRYTVTTAPVDAWVKGVGSEYPLLYPWLVGRVADLTGTPAWELLGKAEALTMSLAVLAGFALWRRWVPGWAAVAIPLLGFALFGDPRKAFEILALVVFLPWALDLFGNPPRRLHWIASGVLAGLLYLTYPGWMIYGAPGLVLLAFLTWRGSAERGRYLGHLAKVVLVAMVVASWQLIPYAAGLFDESEPVSDLFVSAGMFSGLFPFLEFTLLGLLQLVGLVGALALSGRAFWARPLLVIAAGAFAYRIVMTLRYALTGHTMFLHYTPRLYGTALVAAGVLTIAHVSGYLPELAARAGAALRAPRRVGVLVLAIGVAWLGLGLAGQWMPTNDRAGNAAQAHLEPLPSGRYPTYAPQAGRRNYFPVRAVEQAVTAARPGAPTPVVLSSDERLFGYLPWYGYAGTSRTATSSLVRWDSRYAELAKLAGTADPAAFAAAAGQTAFGPIDVFVLHTESPTGPLNWGRLMFSRTQFDPAQWTVSDVGAGTFVAVRR